MLTQCSQCKKTFSIGVSQLHTHSGALHCPHCEEMLGQLKRFKTDVFVNADTEQRSYFGLWFIGFILCLGVLAGQVYWTKGEKISQNPQYRQWLEKICARAPTKWQCRLPVYKNLDEFEIVHGDFQEAGDHYEFQTALSNQADFPQAYPNIKLRLLDFNSQIFAERVFTPEDYLGHKPQRLMAASESIEVNLQIVTPTQKVGGYTFDLI
jgi:hypothetical protein